MQGPRHQYDTRPRNRDRRPGLDIGLNWEQERVEKVKKKEARAKVAKDVELRAERKALQAKREAEGAQMLAALEVEREEEDEEEETLVESWNRQT